jgi:uncharacterized protein (DUF697 family)/tellurite resistance protein
LTKEADALIQVGLAAMVADGDRHEAELGRLRASTEALGVDPALLESVAFGLPADLSVRLTTDESRRAAYEFAVAVCNADGAANEAERRFLAALRAMLGLSEADVLSWHRDADTLATAATTTPTPASAPAAPNQNEIDETILRQAKLTGALELLPQSLATMAIIPLQMRLVYGIGQSYGQTVPASQITDLLGTLGVGMAAQVVDGVARKIVGGVFQGVLGSLLGGLTGGVAVAATGAATSFVTTYALGHVAKRYYEQGRRLSADDLRQLFEQLKGEAVTLYPQVKGQVESQAKSLDLGSILRSVGR